MPASFAPQSRNIPSKELPSRAKSRSLEIDFVNQSPTRAEILSTHTASLFNAAVSRAVMLLRAGELVALPTETVYGLAADALDAKAVAQIFVAKGRPSNNPIIVHVASLEMAQRCVSAWPDAADKLARAFWPGALTMVLPRSKEIPDAVTAGGNTVGIRWPSHPFMQAVIRECGFPLAAPSANPSNEISPTSAAHVSKSLGDKIKLIVDGGQSQVGIESTVVDLSDQACVRILRPGIIHKESLQAVLENYGVQIADHGTSKMADEALRSPGQLPRHYSPKARLQILSWSDTNDLRSQILRLNASPDKTCVIVHGNVPADGAFARVSLIPHDAEAFARAIYSELHQCDELGAELIIVEALPQTNEWHAIADRLKRAAHI